MGDSGDENYATFRTPLELLDEDNLPRKKPTAVQDQYALDEQGRRRFHGAFTGGFSAGYFNTVGSREGWQPQQFKSSRSNKADSIAQYPKDFMDEEDTGEFGIAPAANRPTADFQDHSKGLKRMRTTQCNEGPISATPGLENLIDPVSEGVGNKVLKKMGWKPGQDVECHVTKKEKTRLENQNEKLKIYGCSLPSQCEKSVDNDSESSDNEYTDIKFASDDYEIPIPEPKDNRFGIDYIELDKQPVVSQHINLFQESTFHMQEKDKQILIRGQAFGVGAFEAEDEDVYAPDDMSQYDFSLGPKKKSKSSQKSKPSTSTDCIEGFVPARNPLPTCQFYSPPVLSKDFKPSHTFRERKFYPPIECPDESSQKDSPILNPESRARILVESEVKDIKIGSTSSASNLIIRTLNLHGKEQTAESQRFETKKTKATSSWLEKLKSTNFIKSGDEDFDPIECPDQSLQKDGPMLNSESRARILVKFDVKDIEAGSTSSTSNLIIQTLNLHGKEQTAERQRLEAEKMKATPSWLEKFKSTSFVKVGDEGSNSIECPDQSSQKDSPILNPENKARILVESEVKDIKTGSMSSASNLIIRTLNLHGKEQIAERQRFEAKKTKATPSWLEKLKSTSFVKGGVEGSDSKFTGIQKPDEFSKPFSSDLDKKRRFEEYLELLRSNQQGKLTSLQPLSMTDWDRDQERVEFEKAAKLQQQISANVLLDKFERPSLVEKPDLSVENQTEDMTPDGQMKRAARMKMFGKLTRERIAWQPSSIVCKRFNVPEPKSGCAKPESGKKQSRFSLFDSIDWSTVSKFQKASDSVLTDDSQILQKQSMKVRTETENVPIKKDEKSETENVLTERDEKSKKEKFEDTEEKVFGSSGKKSQQDTADSDEEDSGKKLEEKKDLYKAIFLSSSEDSELETEENMDSEVVKSVLIGKTVSEVNTQRNTSPPRGIFAKLNLDSLVTPLNKKIDSEKKKKKDDEIQIDKDSSQNIETDKSLVDKEKGSQKITEYTLPPDAYGPALPTGLPKDEGTSNQIQEQILQKPVFRSVIVPKLDASLVEGKWIEKTKSKKSKKEKKKHKHKERSMYKRKSKKHKH